MNLTATSWRRCEHHVLRRRVAHVISALVCVAVVAGAPRLAAAPPTGATGGTPTDPAQIVDPSQLGANPSYQVYMLLMVVLAHNTREAMTRYDLGDLTLLTPVLAAALEGPLGRWGVNASMLMDVDVTTTASPDIIATASPRPRELRYAPTLGGHKKFGDADLSLQGSASRVPGRLAISMGGGISVDLRQRTIMPSLDYTFSHDVPDSVGAPLAAFSHNIDRHALDAATIFALDEATLFVPTLSVGIENGDTSRPFRHVPMFSADIAARIPAGLSFAAVAKNRLLVAPIEQLPGNRLRFALTGLFSRRFSSTTIRGEERLYIDSWGVKASTTSAQVLVDAGTRVRLWPELRAYVQTGTDFWRLAYQAEPILDKNKNLTGLTIPALRSERFDLGPLTSVTVGAGVRFALDEKRRFAFTVKGDISYTRFLDHLYIVGRLGCAGATSLEADIP